MHDTLELVNDVWVLQNTARTPESTSVSMGYTAPTGGMLAVGASLETWEWQFGQERPRQIFEVNLVGQLPDGATAEQVGVDWTAGGSGFELAQPRPSCAIERWDGGRWVTLVSSTSATESAPEILSWSSAAISHEGRRALTFAVAPLGVNGYGDAQGQGAGVSTDYVQTFISYNLR